MGISTFLSSVGSSCALTAVLLAGCAHGSNGAHGSASEACTGVGLKVQVLGSGGPIPDDGRASSGYIVWIDGRARVLVDAGGGTFQRFGAAGAALDDLGVIAITHLHTDHSAELPALLKGTFFGNRTEDLALIGPGAGGSFPSIESWLRALFAPEEGAYRYLSWLLDAQERFSLAIRSVDPARREPEVVYDRDELRIEAIGVEHGPVPALAYRMTHHGQVLVFSGDQNGNNPEFAELASTADVLVMDHAIPEDADEVARKLHARPSEIADLARHAQPDQLVLSHHMARSLETMEQDLALIRARYRGQVTVAEDRLCIQP